MLSLARMRCLVALLALLLVPPSARAAQPAESEDDTTDSVTDDSEANPYDDQDGDDRNQDQDVDRTEAKPDPGQPDTGTVSPASPVPPEETTRMVEQKAVTTLSATETVAGDRDRLGFVFGSYGRIGVGTDLRGSTPEPVAVVLKGSRIVEPSYMETDLHYRMRTARGVGVKTVTTLAFAGDPFHYTGEFDTHLAVRNLYAQADLPSGLALWIGSRMYRGDDIYLLDYWPLDDVNTLGGGLMYRRDRLDAAVHVGANRLLDPFQYQERAVTDPVFGSTEIVVLDRQRMVASATGAYRLLDPAVNGIGMKAKLYFEAQALPSGSRLLEDDSRESLPSDFGWTAGGQLGLWGFGEGLSHANLFVRFSQGLTAFDELQLPEGFDVTKKTFPGASELVLAVSANYEFLDRGGAMLGGYARRFVDADPNTADRDDGWEYIIDVRPHYALVGNLEAGVDLSYQVRFPRGLSPTMLIPLDPAVFQVAPMLIYSPFGVGSYDRPAFRLVYRAADLNEGARDLYPLEDPRRDRKWVHYLGIQAEWWFNSSYR